MSDIVFMFNSDSPNDGKGPTKIPFSSPIGESTQRPINSHQNESSQLKTAANGYDESFNLHTPPMPDGKQCMKKYLRENTTEFEMATLLPPILFSKDSPKTSASSYPTESLSLLKTSQILYMVTDDTPEILKSSPTYQPQPANLPKSSPVQVEQQTPITWSQLPLLNSEFLTSDYEESSNQGPPYNSTKDIKQEDKTYSVTLNHKSSTTQKSLRSLETKKKVTRSRTGCWTCRIRHKSCPEQRPTCQECKRLTLQCDYSQQKPSYIGNPDLVRNKLAEIKLITDGFKRAKLASRRNLNSQTKPPDPSTQPSL